MAAPSGAVSYTHLFARANRNTLSELDSFAHDVFTFLATGLKAMPHGSDVAATSERIIALVATRSPCLLYTSRCV